MRVFGSPTSAKGRGDGRGNVAQMDGIRGRWAADSIGNLDNFP